MNKKRGHQHSQSVEGVLGSPSAGGWGLAWPSDVFQSCSFLLMDVDVRVPGAMLAAFDSSLLSLEFTLCLLYRSGLIWYPSSPSVVLNGCGGRSRSLITAIMGLRTPSRTSRGTALECAGGSNTCAIVNPMSLNSPDRQSEGAGKPRSPPPLQLPPDEPLVPDTYLFSPGIETPGHRLEGQVRTRPTSMACISACEIPSA